MLLSILLSYSITALDTPPVSDAKQGKSVAIPASSHDIIFSGLPRYLVGSVKLYYSISVN